MKAAPDLRLRKVIHVGAPRVQRRCCQLCNGEGASKRVEHSIRNALRQSEPCLRDSIHTRIQEKVHSAGTTAPSECREPVLLCKSLFSKDSPCD